MSRMKTTVSFLLGVAVGGAAAWYFTKDFYARLSEEDINSVKEAYAKREQKNSIVPDILPDPVADESDTETENTQDNENVLEYLKRVQTEERQPKYSKTVVPQKEEQESDSKTADIANENPYVISPEEFGENEDYANTTLLYFEDGVLSDEYGVIVDDIDALVGNALEYLEEEETDSVYVRSDLKRCDYEILRDYREYSEFRKTLPTNI